MTLHYEQTIDDVVALGLYNKKNASTAKRMSRTVPFVLLVAALSFNFYVRYSNGYELFTNDMLLLIALSVVFLLLRSEVFYKWWARRQYSRKGFESWYGPRTVVLTEAALIAKAATMETNYSWGTFRKFAETDQYFFLFTSAIQAIVIPRRIFLLPQEEYEVKSFIERKLADQKQE